MIGQKILRELLLGLAIAFLPAATAQAQTPDAKILSNVKTGFSAYLTVKTTPMRLVDDFLPMVSTAPRTGYPQPLEANYTCGRLEHITAELTKLLQGNTQSIIIKLNRQHTGRLDQELESTFIIDRSNINGQGLDSIFGRLKFFVDEMAKSEMRTLKSMGLDSTHYRAQPTPPNSATPKRHLKQCLTA